MTYLGRPTADPRVHPHHETEEERRAREPDEEAREQTWQRRWRREALGLNRGK